MVLTKGIYDISGNLPVIANVKAEQIFLSLCANNTTRNKDGPLISTFKVATVFFWQR